MNAHGLSWVNPNSFAREAAGPRQQGEQKITGTVPEACVGEKVIAKYFVTVLGCCRWILQTKDAVGMGTMEAPGKSKAIFRMLEHNLQLLMLTQIFVWFHVLRTLLLCMGIISASDRLPGECLNWNAAILKTQYHETVI